MKQIIANDNIIVRLESDRWRMISDVNDDLKIVAEVSGEDFKYRPSFGNPRRLPTNGRIRNDQIEKVVLGFSNEHHTWQLGLVFNGTLAEERNSRWCELVSWANNNEGLEIPEEAREAGETLATVISAPFDVIERQPQIVETPETISAQPLPGLPLQFGFWRLIRPDSDWKSPFETVDDSEQLLFVRSPRWKHKKYRRLGWYGFWVLVYLVLSIATLTSGIALPNAGTLLPNPKVLPYLGLITALILFGLVVRTLLQLRTSPNIVVLDANEKSISAWRENELKWRITGKGVHSVYVSEVTRKRDRNYAVYFGEINIRQDGDIFQYVLDQGTTENNHHARLPLVQKYQADCMIRLNPNNVNTDLQVAGLYIAKALGDLPCWHDVRAK